MSELYVSHLHGYNGVTEKIKRAMYKAAKDFVYIGFLLREVRNNKFYEEGGYESVYAYAEFELGFKRSSTKNFIAIAETFGVQQIGNAKYETKQTMCLQPAYENFNYSQLTEMLSMSSAQRAKATPDMSVKDLRSLKMKDRIETIKNTPPPASMLPAKAGGQTSGQMQLSQWDWISVNKGLPETDKRVLVCCETKAHIQSINLAYYDGQAWHGSGSMAGVTHWMELPSLPTVKGSQEPLQAVVVNNYWTDLRPSVIRKLLNVAHLKYNPKSTYKIEIQTKKDNG